jgi:hypothetical protein
LRIRLLEIILYPSNFKNRLCHLLMLFAIVIGAKRNE